MLRAGHEWWRDGHRWSAVIHLAYGDVSGKESGTLTGACYLGKEPDWMDAIAAWCKALDDAGVKEFHATDFFSAWGEFNDDRWRRYDAEKQKMVPGGPLHDEFAERFTAIPVAHKLLGFAHSTDVPAFNGVLAPELAREQRIHPSSDPRTWVIMRSLASAGGFLEQTTYRDRESIQAVFEHEKGAGGAAPTSSRRESSA